MKKTGYDFNRYYSIVLGCIDSDRSDFHEPRSNSKLEDIPAWNLAPGITCSAPACSHCLMDGCYAVKNALCHGYNIDTNSCLKAWAENTALAVNHPDILEFLLDRWLARKNPPTFRIHSAGDFFSVDYAEMWKRLAEKHPQTRFLAFTKQFDIIRSVPFYTVPNFELVLSGWTGVIIPEDLRTHYRCAWCNDGTENRIPADAIRCPGNCNKCRCCWNLSRLGKDSYFDKH